MLGAFQRSTGLVHSSARFFSRNGAMTNGENETPALQLATDTNRVTPVAPIWHTVVLVVFIVGASITSGRPQLSAGANQYPGRILLYVSSLILDIILVGYIWLFGLRRYGVSIGTIIGGKWHRQRDFWRDIGIAALFWLVVFGMLAFLSITMKFSGVEAAKFMFPQTPLELGVFVALGVTAGFCEELIFRGYLQRQFTAWTGQVAAGVVLQAIVFGIGHIYQGIKGVIAITLYGALFGILAAMRKSLRPGMMQHGAQDAFSGILVYIATKYKIITMLRF